MSADYKTDLKKIMDTVKKSVPTIQSVSGIKSIYSILKNTHNDLLKLQKYIPVKDLDMPLIPGKRSFRQNVIHLLNSENLNSMIIIQALTIDKPELLPIHSERDIGALSLFEEFDIKELLTYFKLRRRMLMSLLNSLTNEQWARKIIEKNKSRQESIYWRARSLALHEYEHIQIMKFQMT